MDNKRKRGLETDSVKADGEPVSKKVDSKSGGGGGGMMSFTIQDIEKESTNVNGGMFGILLDLETLKTSDRFKKLLVAGNARLSCRRKNLALMASGAFYPNGIFKYNLFNTCVGASRDSQDEFVIDRFFSHACLIGDGIEELIDDAYRDTLKYRYLVEFEAFKKPESMKHFDANYSSVTSRDEDYFGPLLRRLTTDQKNVPEYEIPEGKVLILCTTLVDLLTVSLGGINGFETINPVIFKEDPVVEVSDVTFDPAVQSAFEGFVCLVNNNNCLYDDKCRKLKTDLTKDIYVELVNILLLYNGINREMQPNVITYLEDFYKAIVNRPTLDGRTNMSSEYARALPVFTLNYTKFSGLVDLLESPYGVSCPVDYTDTSYIYTKLMYELAMVTGPRTAVTCKLPESDKEFATRINEGILGLMKVSLNENPTSLVYFVQLCRALQNYKVPVSLKNALKRAKQWTPEVEDYLILHKGEFSECPGVSEDFKRNYRGGYDVAGRTCKLTSSCDALPNHCPYEAMNRLIESEFLVLSEGIRKSRRIKKTEQAPSVYLMDETTTGKYLDKIGSLSGLKPTQANPHAKVHAVRLKEQILNQLTDNNNNIENERLKNLTEKSVRSACSDIDEAIKDVQKIVRKAAEEHLREDPYAQLLNSGGVFEERNMVTLCERREYWRFKSVVKSVQLPHSLLYAGFSEIFVNMSRLYRLSMTVCSNSSWTASIPSSANIKEALSSALSTNFDGFYVQNMPEDKMGGGGSGELDLNTAYATVKCNTTKSGNTITLDLATANQREKMKFNGNFIRIGYCSTKCLLGFYRQVDPDDGDDDDDAEEEEEVSDAESDGGGAALLEIRKGINNNNNKQQHRRRGGDDVMGKIKRLYKNMIRENRLKYGSDKFLRDDECKILDKFTRPSAQVVGELMHDPSGLLRLFSLGHPVENWQELIDLIVTATIMKRLGVETKGLPRQNRGVKEFKPESDFSGLTFLGPSKFEPDRKIIHKSKTLGSLSRGPCVIMCAVQQNTFDAMNQQTIREFKLCSPNDCALLNKLQLTMRKQNVLHSDDSNNTISVYYYPLGSSERYAQQTSTGVEKTTLDKFVNMDHDDEMGMLELMKTGYRKIYSELFRGMCKLNGDADYADKDIEFDLEYRRDVAGCSADVLLDIYGVSEVEHLLSRIDDDYELNSNIRALDYLITLLTSDDEERCKNCYQTHIEELRKKEEEQEQGGGDEVSKEDDDDDDEVQPINFD